MEDEARLTPCKNGKPKYTEITLFKAWFGYLWSPQISKAYPDYNPYSGVYSLLPDTSDVNHSVKRQYINGHYCYAHKIGIMTNGNGIIRDIAFLMMILKMLILML